MPEISLARSAAHAMLLAIEAGLGHSDELLRDHPAMQRMSDADRRLTTALVLGVLRWQILLDERLRGSLAKPKMKLDPAVLIALRLGAFQLLHLDRIPGHAVINESVEITKQTGCRSAAGLVNAVLRKIAQTTDKTPIRCEESLVTGHNFSRAAGAPGSTRALAPEGSPLPALAAHPSWLIDRWAKSFGSETACAICIHDQSAPVSSIRLATPAAESELIHSGLALAPGKLLTAARIVESGNLRDTAAFREGGARIQDEGSQLIAELAASIFEEPKEILDCCAAPGGKTMILAERHPSARIVACETSRPRLQQLRQRLSRFGERVECRHADATALSFDSEFDLALADVPCSGTGTLGRNPEIRHRLRPDDLPRHSERQRAILRSALRALRPGGRVLYSTCSLEQEENEQVAGDMVAQNLNARVVPLGPALHSLQDRGVLAIEAAERLHMLLTPDGFLRIVPGAFETDGFFLAMLERGSMDSD